MTKKTKTTTKKKKKMMMKHKRKFDRIGLVHRESCTNAEKKNDKINTYPEIIHDVITSVKNERESDARG